MTLIKQIETAVNNGKLPEWFTTAKVKRWIVEYNIRKTDGSPFAKSTINSELSNRDVGNSPTTNLSKKVLESRVNSGKKEYHFLEQSY